MTAMPARFVAVPPLDGYDHLEALLGARVDVRRTGQPELLTPRAPESLHGHLARVGIRPSCAGPAGIALIDRLDDWALTGRGGGHFPVARKWQAVIDAGGGGVVVANAAEGEPASAKDATLLQLHPHLVLDGLALAAEATGADTCVVWLHQGAVPVRRAVARAIAERRAAGLREPAARIAAAPGHYLSGESSAVVRGLSGGPALPAFTQRPAAVSGVDGRPTLVNNAETLARVALAARFDSPPLATALLTVTTPSHRAVLEVGGGATFEDVLTSSGWPADIRPQAVLLGGYGGSWARWSQAGQWPAQERALRSAGVSLGAGIVAPIGPSCGLAEAAAIAGYLADSSARQCGPCMFGLPAVAASLRRLADADAPRRELSRLRSDLEAIRGRGACHHPDGAIRMIASAIEVFADDLAAHARGRGCGRPATLPVPEPRHG